MCIILIYKPPALSLTNFYDNLDDLLVAITCKFKTYDIFLIGDKVKKVEILLALKLEASNYFFNLFGDISDVLKAAFTNSDIAQHIKLGATKVPSVVMHGLLHISAGHF